SRQEGLHIMRQDGIINQNEWRELEEMNPVEGGDVYLINGNMVSTSGVPSAREGGETE
ncbi:phage portal protein, HK97 family, partial [Brevibacillus agri BAB-2500]